MLSTLKFAHGSSHADSVRKGISVNPTTVKSCNLAAIIAKGSRLPEQNYGTTMVTLRWYEASCVE